MCGVFGIFGHKESARLTYLGLYSLQHRGQESAGIVTSDSKMLHYHLGVGLVADIFPQKVLDKLKGKSAIGHVRYSTAGSDPHRDAQPIMVKYNQKVGDLAIAHNGNLLNSDEIRAELQNKGCVFKTTSDTEVIPRLLTRGWTGVLEHDLPWTLRQIRGAYSLLLLTKNDLIGARDPYGVRPLCLGQLDNGAYVLSSETLTFNLVGAKFVREINPGEIVIINKKGIKSITFAEPLTQTNECTAFCIFEFIYFSRPDSTILGKNVHLIRENLGKQLYQEKKTEADIVISIPDSANSCAMGYAQAIGVPFEAGLIRNHYIGRTFIEPHQSIRDFGAKIKYSPIREVVQDKRVVVIDDSIVRGTTSRKLMNMLRSSGAKEIHLRISCPPIKHSCFYGIDTPTEKELIASTHTISEIRKYLGVDSLHYLSLDGMLKSTGLPKERFCVACFTGKYPL